MLKVERFLIWGSNLSKVWASGQNILRMQSVTADAAPQQGRQTQSSRSVVRQAWNGLLGELAGQTRKQSADQLGQALQHNA